MLPIHTANVSTYNHFNHWVIAVAAYQPHLSTPRSKKPHGVIRGLQPELAAQARTD
jgi:hypothetical protein